MRGEMFTQIASMILSAVLILGLVLLLSYA